MIDGVSSLYTSGWKYMQYQSQQTESSTASETSPQPPPGRRPDSSAESTEQENMNWATPPPPPQMQVDTDGDGSWSEDELSALASDIQEKTGQTIDTEAILSQYDVNSDGTLDESEQKDFLDSLISPSGMEQNGGAMAAGNMPPPPPMQVDTDGDGSWSEDELSALASDIQEKTGQTIDTEAILSQYDADSDGALSESEQKDFLDSVMKQPPPGSLQDSPAVQETEESDDNSLKIKMIDLLLSKYKSSAGSEEQTTSQAIDALS